MRIIKDCYLIHGKDTHHFSKQEICKGRFGCSEVDESAEAADFASKSHSTSLPKSTQLQEARQKIPVLWEGNAGLPHRPWGRQGAAVRAVGCG